MKRVMLGVLGAALLMGGCGQEEMIPADQVTEALFELSVKNDAGPIQELLGFSTEEEARAAFMAEDAQAADDFSQALMQDFQAVGVEFTEGEITEISEDITAMIQKLSCTAAVSSETEEQAVVDMTVSGFSMSDLDQLSADLQDDLMANMDQELVSALLSGDEEAMNDFMKDVAMQYLDALGQLEPSQETELSVPCAKTAVDVDGREKVVWLPDLETFEADLESAIMK